MNTFNKKNIFKIGSLLTVSILLVCVALNFSETKDNKEISINNTKANGSLPIARDTEGDTFSIVAYDPATGEFGGAGTSCVGIQIDFLNQIIVDNNGNMLGAINAQAAARTQNAVNAKNRMLAGDTPQEIIDWLDANDCCNGGAAARQYGIIGFDDNGLITTAGYTGTTNGVFGGHITGPTYAIQGNILDETFGQQILEGMEAGFLGSQGSLADKLMAALQGAKRVGADKRCGPDAISTDGPFLPNNYQSGQASFVRVRTTSDTGVIDNIGTNNTVDISIGPINAQIEPIDVLQCDYDTAMGNTGFFCRETVNTFPYSMDFETRTWEQEASCGVANAWIRSRYASPSNNTGASEANQGDFYTYFEATDLGNGLGTTGYIGSPCFEIPEDKAGLVSFDYHMLGANIGTLSLEANDGSGWVELWSDTGDKGAAWQTANNISLIDYTGKSVKLRFKAAASNVFSNDFGLDDIQVTTEDYCNTPVTFTGSWNTTPNVRSSATISSNFDTSVDGSFDACSLVITNNATLTIKAETFANIRGDITVNSGSKIIVEHQGNLVQMLESATATNNGEIDVNITTPALNARDFMIVGSPMNTENEAVFNGAYQVLSHNTDNYTMYTSQAISGINFYDEGADELAPKTGTLNAGEGFIVRPSYTEDDTYNYTFNSGTLNSGEVIYTAGYNGNKNDSANLIANPYPSAIDANLFLAENSGIVSEIYFWEHLTPVGETNGPYGTQNFSMNDISTYNNMGGTSAAGNGGGIPNNIISTAQGFGIKANAGGDIKFTNAMRVTSGNTTLRTASTATSLTDANRLWLSISEAESNNSSSNLIGFTSSATAGIDYGFDTERIGTLVSLYTHLEDGTERLSIQSRESFDSSIQIPMGFSSIYEDESTYTISILNREGGLILDATVYLIDNLTGTTTYLNENDYVFTSNGGTYDERFTVVFEERNVLNTDVADLLEVSLSPNPASSFVDINAGTTFMKTITVYDINGRKVISVDANNTSTYRLNTQNLNTGMYLVSIKTDNSTITKRLIKK